MVVIVAEQLRLRGGKETKRKNVVFSSSAIKYLFSVLFDKFSIAMSSVVVDYKIPILLKAS